MPWIERRGVLSVQSVDVILQLAHQETGSPEYLMLHTHSSVLDRDTGNNNSYV